jgi:hypothetical protein
MIEIVDEPKQINHRFSYNSNNAVCYFGRSGNKYPAGGSEGQGFWEDKQSKLLWICQTKQ